MNIKWDADDYTQNFDFVHKYGEGVIGLFDTIEGKRIIDLGCGNGALTKQLSDLGAKAIGIDGSKELLEIAKNNYPDLEFVYGDATAFTVEEKADAVFSNAVFHWIEKEKQLDMLKCVYDALKEGGELIFEFGGYENTCLIHDMLNNEFEKRGLSYTNPFYFPTIGEYAAFLELSGFKVQYATLFDRFTELKGENGLYYWIYLFVKSPFTNVNVDEKTKEEIIKSAVSNLKNDLYKDGKWYADYVRLRAKAVKI